MKTVRIARPDELVLCHRIRRSVFIEGQGVPEAIEVDGRDEACTHFLVLVDDRPVATARLREVEGAAKAERVAVLAACRGRGYGHDVMGALESNARERGFAAVVLGAQEPVIPFYERRGYVAYGPRFVEADIPHRMMRLAL